MSDQEQLTLLRQQEEAAHRAWSDLRDRRKALEQSILERECPIKVGDLIEWTRCNEGKRGIVRAVIGSPKSPDFIVFPLKKDGTPGVKPTKVWTFYNNPRKVKEKEKA